MEVLRFSDIEVMKSTNDVIEAIVNKIKEKLACPSQDNNQQP